MSSKIIVFGQCPSKSNGYGLRNGVMYKTKSLVAYEDSFYLQCVKYRGMYMDCFFELYMDVYFQSNRSDIDGSLKIILDTLQDKVRAFKNDNKCVGLYVRKAVDKKNPRVEFEIKFLE